jgi:hypothetical protein
VSCVNFLIKLNNARGGGGRGGRRGARGGARARVFTPTQLDWRQLRAKVKGEGEGGRGRGLSGEGRAKPKRQAPRL